MKKIKFIKRQDSGFKLSYGNSGETSLNLSNEIFDFISQGALSPGEEKNITFRIYKEDCIKAMSFIIMKLPLYKSSSNYSNKVSNYLEIFGELYSKIEAFFGVNKDADYKVSLFYRPDGRIYLKGLRITGFSIRDYLVENFSALQFDNEGDGLLNLRVLSDIEDNGMFEDEEALGSENILSLPFQQIFYGAPGTGKSNTIKREVDDKGKLNFRTTFHPDSDYSTFVGTYKPSMKPTGVTLASGEREEVITYKFIPQAFTRAYVEAWKTTDDVFLVIEEINRGNCAQIFGDLFQLLDRKDGVSEYPVEADTDLATYLAEALAGSERNDIPADVKNGTKLKLPSNLYIWATMNTSDQSLFPIDSAFKRRWEWKYMKIKNEGKEWKIDTKIKDENGDEKLVDWWDFISKVNEIIASMTSSADKQLGYFFCKADKKTQERASDTNSENDLISLDTFVSKVLFYLWNDVFKDYGFEDASLFQYIKTEDGKDTKKDLTFPDFYEEYSNEVNPTMVTDFVQKVMNWKKKVEENI